MKVEKVGWITLVLLISTFLVACGGGSSIAGEGGGTEDLPPVAVVKARQALAAELNLGIEIVAIHPGWQVILSTGDGETYEVRTDELGEIIRIKQ
jgi:hypothetical protein